LAARLIDGKAIAARIRERVADQIKAMPKAPGLATILVGDDPASEVYVRMKRQDSAEVGIASFHHPLSAEVSEAELGVLIGSLNADQRVNGILLQLPLPAHLNPEALIAMISPAKDVDGLSPLNAGLLAHARAEAIVPCTPQGVIELLREEGAQLRGARAVVVGRSILVGKPLAALLLAADATVTQCHSQTRDLGAVCREAEVLVAAAGSPELIGAEMVRPGAIVIDVGSNYGPSGVKGDVDFAAVSEVASAITPVPGGVGPMTRAMLLSNTVVAANLQLGA
jgi:methylenetetrahydrofolate dehydrogenase (NADP+)/methenyltetrahydrofolate cyclohydrolase